MRLLVAALAAALLPATVFATTAFAASGTTASVGGSAREDKFTLGVSFAAYMTGLAYWTWNGYGQSDGEHWASSQHGIDINLGNAKFGPTVEFKAEEDDIFIEPGVRLSIKLW
jgi:hypothetical protein